MFQEFFDSKRRILLNYVGGLPSRFIVTLPVDLILENLFMRPLPTNSGNHPTFFLLVVRRQNKLDCWALRRLEATTRRVPNILSKNQNPR